VGNGSPAMERKVRSLELRDMESEKFLAGKLLGVQVASG